MGDFPILLSAIALLVVAYLNVVNPRPRCPECGAYRGWATGWLHRWTCFFRDRSS